MLPPPGVDRELERPYGLAGDLRFTLTFMDSATAITELHPAQIGLPSPDLDTRVSGTGLSQRSHSVLVHLYFVITPRLYTNAPSLTIAMQGHSFKSIRSFLHILDVADEMCARLHLEIVGMEIPLARGRLRLYMCMAILAPLLGGGFTALRVRS